MSDRSTGWGLLLVILATSCWSTSGVFIKTILGRWSISPVGLAFWRDLATFCAIFLAVALFRPRMLRVDRRDVPWLASMGAISIGLFHVLWNTSVLVNGVAVATVLQSNAPILVTVAAWILWGECLTRRKIVAIALAVFGTALMSGPEGLGVAKLTPGGVLLGLGVAAALGSFSLFGKKMSASYSAWTILVYAFGFGTLVLAPFQFGDRSLRLLPVHGLGYFAGLVLIATVLGFTLYTAGLARLQASVAAITANTEVPFAAGLSFALLGERLGPWQVLGAVLILSGVTLVSLPQAR